MSGAGGDDRESSVEGVGGSSRPDMGGVGRVTEDSVEQSELICVEVLCGIVNIMSTHLYIYA